jgi:prepilin-type processing-associated H-X9-DG protein
MPGTGALISAGATANQFTAAHLAARSYHPGGVNCVFVDGSVHFAGDSIKRKTATCQLAATGGRPSGKWADLAGRARRVGRAGRVCRPGPRNRCSRRRWLAELLS